MWDGDALVAEYNSSGAISERYVHGPAVGVDDPLFWYHGAAVNADTRRQLYADHQGSIVAVTDAVGNRLNINRYDEYGIPAAGNAGRFQYTGQIWLPELGLYHYKARIYSPARAGSCRPIRWGMTTSSICMPMYGTIPLIWSIRPASVAAYQTRGSGPSAMNSDKIKLPKRGPIFLNSLSALVGTKLRTLPPITKTLEMSLYGWEIKPAGGIMGK